MFFFSFCFIHLTMDWTVFPCFFFPSKWECWQFVISTHMIIIYFVSNWICYNFTTESWILSLRSLVRFIQLRISQNYSKFQWFCSPQTDRNSQIFRNSQKMKKRIFWTSRNNHIWDCFQPNCASWCFHAYFVPIFCFLITIEPIFISLCLSLALCVLYSSVFVSYLNEYLPVEPERTSNIHLKCFKL